MGREVRRVPKDWEHPKDENGNYIPQSDWSYSQMMQEWEEGLGLWLKGEHPDQLDVRWSTDDITWEEWHGNRPDPGRYMPDWPDEERTHYQMYEDTSEGTPISPVMESPESLARWLADNNVSAFADMTASYEAWLRIAKGGYAPGAVLVVGGFQSGVEALKDEEP